MRSTWSLGIPALSKSCLSIPYLLIGFFYSGFRITPGMSRCSASWRVSFIQVSSTLGLILLSFLLELLNLSLTATLFSVESEFFVVLFPCLPSLAIVFRNFLLTVEISMKPPLNGL